jgi:hypothetical protein
VTPTSPEIVSPSYESPKLHVITDSKAYAYALTTTHTIEGRTFLSASQYAARFLLRSSTEPAELGRGLLEDERSKAVTPRMETQLSAIDKRERSVQRPVPKTNSWNKALYITMPLDEVQDSRYGRRSL